MRQSRPLTGRHPQRPRRDCFHRLHACQINRQSLPTQASSGPATSSYFHFPLCAFAMASSFQNSSAVIDVNRYLDPKGGKKKK
jgi:hypothetical protein